MDASVQTVLDTYHARMRDEESRMQEALSTGRIGEMRNEVLLPIGPATGQLVHILVKSLKSPMILELGTSYGYSGIWLADAARATGGRVVTMELEDYKVKYAREMSAKAGLADYVDFKIGDAVQMIAELPHGIDFVLLDLWKELYVPCLDVFYPKLNPGAIIVADNMLHPPSSADAVAEYRRAVHAKPGISSVLLPVGSGIEISRYDA